MTTRKKRVLILFFVLSLFFLLKAAIVLGQDQPQPTRTQCKQWDDAYLALFDYSLWGTFVGTFVLALAAGFLGRTFWWCAAPRMRIFIVTLFCVSLAVLGVALGPWVVGLGHYWFGGVDSRYYDCEGVPFNGTGLFGGLVGDGVAAIALWPFMIFGLAGAAILGGALAWFVSWLANRTLLGVPAKIKGEAV